MSISTLIVLKYLLQDNNESYDLPSVREFSDVYFFTKDIDVSASLSDPFTADPLPDIGQNSNVSKSSKKNSIMSNNVFKKVSSDVIVG